MFIKILNLNKYATSLIVFTMVKTPACMVSFWIQLSGCRIIFSFFGKEGETKDSQFVV